MCAVELAVLFYVPSSALHGGIDYPANETFFLDNAMQMNPNGSDGNETAVHYCHCLGHMLGCTQKALAIPRKPRSWQGMLQC